MRYRIELDCDAHPLDKMWVLAELNADMMIVDDNDRFGSGSVNSVSTQREYKFSLYENSEEIAGLDWVDGYDAGELHILKQRLAVGSIHRFRDAGHVCFYKITKITPCE